MSPAGEATAGPAPSSAATNATLSCVMAFSCSVSPAFSERYPLAVLGPGIDGGRADDFTVDPLLDDVSGPSRGARDHENGGEHRSRHAHHVVRDRTIPVQV